MSRIFLFLFLLPIIIGCSAENDGSESDALETYTHGKLKYSITYLNAKEDGYDPLVLPPSMTLEFNQEYCINAIEGFMNMFRLANTILFKEKKVFTHMKYFDQNYAYIGGKDDMMCCFDPMENMIVTEDKKTMSIAGLHSKRAIVTFPDRPDTFEIYYTHQIDLTDPNETNPYHQVKGVLTSFRLSMGQYKMEFRATDFDPDSAPDIDSPFPKGSFRVTREYLIAALSELMSEYP